MEVRDASSLFELFRRRINALRGISPLEFAGTPEKEREQFLKDVAELEGYSEDEVRAEEALLNVTFPEVFRQFLITMGKRRGPLFVAHDFARLGWFTYYREDAEEELAANRSHQHLPANAVVFLRTPYPFCFIESKRGFDAPIWSYNPDDDSYYEVSPSCWNFIDDELKSKETNSRDLRGLIVQVAGNSTSIATRSFPSDDQG